MITRVILDTRMKILDDISITLRIYFEHETILFKLVSR